MQWVAAEVRRRRRVSEMDAGTAAPPRGNAWGMLRPRFFLAAAATGLLAASVGYVVWDREPRVRDLAATVQQYRTAQLHAIAPVGDIRAAPAVLEWVSSGEAETYEVVVLEVDRTILWRGSSVVPRAMLPASLIAQFAPGKRVLWEVRALNRSGAVIAASGTQQFRVTAGP